MNQINVLGHIYNNIKKATELDVGDGKGVGVLISLQGSARSGKTYNTMIWLIMQCLASKIKVSVVRQSLPSLKRSAYEDFKKIMYDMHIFNERRMNKTDMVYFFENGSVIEFMSAEEGQKLRGPNRDILFCNEANELEEEVFSQLRMRTNKYTIIDYNPSFDEDHWIFRLNADKRTYHFISTYKENLFLSKAIVAEIESYKVTNPTMWQIYGLGQRAIIEGLVFPQENWDIIPDDAFPTWIHEGYVGLDWGMTHDPSVGEHVILNGNDVYVNEIFRSTGMKTQDIADALRDYDDLQKYCDIDNRLVAELEDADINLLSMTIKNGESIKVGIAIMNQRKIHITESSVDLIKEFKNYVYKKDRYDQYQIGLNPVDKFNHGIDALRYVILAESHVEGRQSANKVRTKRDLGLFL